MLNEHFLDRFLVSWHVHTTRAGPEATSMTIPGFMVDFGTVGSKNLITHNNVNLALITVDFGSFDQGKVNMIGLISSLLWFDSKDA